MTGKSEKQQVLNGLAGNTPVIPLGGAKYLIKERTVHVRFCSANPKAPGKFKFNINPNTLSADVELWICGNPSVYYLLPIGFIRAIYDNPKTYKDRHHNRISIVSVDTNAHRVVFALGGQSDRLLPYYRSSL